TDLGNLGSSTAAALGGGAAYNSGTGTISAPSYDVYGSTDSNVGQAITDLQTKAPVQYSDASGNPTPLVPSNDVTLVGAAAGPVALHNVAAGAVGSTSTDAVNGSQLYATNQSVAANTSAIATNSGDISALQTDALQWNSTLGTYDASHGSGNPQRIGNVADATQAHDAVNLEQLQSTVGTATADAVMYDNATHGSVTLGGTGATSPVALTNIQAGALNATSTDAVNGSQLYATNQNVAANTSAIATNTGNITALQQNALQWNPALNGGMGAYDASYGGSAQVITNVASGALNATSTDAVNGSQLYATNQNVAANTTAIATTTTNLDNLGNSTASALGGGAAYNSGTGTISAPSYDVYGNSDSNVGQAISDLQTKAPVQYSDASGNPTPQVPSNDVTLVGAAAGPVALHNVAAGAVGSTSTDAVNGSQLYAVQQTAGAGWNLSANGGTAVNVAPGATLDISAGPSGNAIVTQNGTSLTFDVSDNPNFTTVTASGGITAGGAINANGGLAIAAGQTINMGGNTVGNVAAGSLSATSTDAVNGSQLYATNQNVAANAANLQTLGTGMAAGLGGASSYDPLTGTLTTSIEYDGNSYGSVQSVFDQINGAVNGGAGIKYFHVNSTGADSQALGSDSVAIGADAVATNVGDVAIGSGSVTGAATATSGVTLWGSAYNFAGAAPTSVFSVGSAGNERQVTNVAAGQLNATSTDAVNGSQLYATNQAVNSLGTQVNTNTSNISNLQGQINTINQNGAGMFQVSRDLNNQPMPTPTGTNSAAGGAGASASGTNSLAMGNDSNAGGDQSTAVGTSAAASGTGSTAIGQGAEASGNNSVAIGAGSVATGDNTVSVGSAGNLRQITNVAAGTAPTDAATVGQLRAAQSGGVQYDSNTDGSTDYTNVTMDQGGAPATIHNVATGTAANDAVNVGQLNAGISTAENWAQTYTDQRFNQVQSDLSKLGNRANAGIASAIAAANLPQPYAPNQSALSVGLGTFRGETGMAVGLSKITESGRYILKANASSDTRGDLGAGVGAAVVW
ncbi:MAG TPA: YadA-like family protein, partial [Rhodanobacteraceae bacterium]|nr:YadA-like family protein [Rhodanobacteraceae bacterium]